MGRQEDGGGRERRERRDKTGGQDRTGETEETGQERKMIIRRRQNAG